jgi:hypothetical protein
MFCLWFHVCNEVVLGWSIFLVHWPPYGLHEWCFQWILNFFEGDFEYGSGGMDIGFEHRYGNLSFHIARVSILMHYHCLIMHFMFLSFELFSNRQSMTCKGSVLKQQQRSMMNLRNFFLYHFLIRMWHMLLGWSTHNTSWNHHVRRLSPCSFRCVKKILLSS